MSKNILCPACQKKSTMSKDNAYRPFCSKRCKLMDLGDWASEKFRVAGEKAPAPSDEEQGEE